MAADVRLLDVLDEVADIKQLAPVRSMPSSATSIAGVDVFQVELNRLRSSFGPASVTRLSAREGSPLALCYFADDVVIIFRAGAMGGWKRVTGFTAVRVDSLSGLRISCIQSATLIAWRREFGNDVLNPQQLSKKLGISSLPANGIVATKDWVVDNKEYFQTTTVAYSQGASLTWVDISQFVER